MVGHGQLALVQYVREWVLSYDKKREQWTAPWWSALWSDKMPGESSYLTQAWESHWDVIKDSLPANVRNAQPTTAVRLLSSAFEAVAKSHEWVESAQVDRSHEKWMFSAKFHKEMVPEGLSSRYVCGPKLFTERLLTEEEEQWTVMTLDKLIEHTPSNYNELKLSDRPCLFRGVRVQYLFVVPLFQENLRVDLAMAETVWDLLFCTNSATRSKARLDAGIMVPDGAGTRYSMQGARSFFHAVAAVLVLASGDVLCHCQDFMVRHECAHQYYVRYLRKEQGMHDFTSMVSLTRGCSLLMSGFVCLMIVWKTAEQ